jgi:hypothetical protein
MNYLYPGVKYDITELTLQPGSLDIYGADLKYSRGFFEPGSGKITIRTTDPGPFTFEHELIHNTQQARSIKQNLIVENMLTETIKEGWGMTNEQFNDYLRERYETYAPEDYLSELEAEMGGQYIKAPSTFDMYPSVKNTLKNIYGEPFIIESTTTNFKRTSLPSETVSKPVQLDLKLYENKLTEAGRYVGPGLPAEGVVPRADFVRFSDVIPETKNANIFSLNKKGSAQLSPSQFEDSGVYARLKSGVSDLRGGFSELESGGQIVGAVEEPSSVTRPAPIVFNPIIGGSSQESETEKDIFTRIKPRLILNRKYVNTGVAIESKNLQEDNIDIFTRIKPKNTSIIKLGQVQTPIIDVTIRQEPIPRIYTPLRVPPLRFERPGPPEIPPPTIIKPPKAGKIGEIFGEGYDVLVRKKGIFEKINTEPLSKGGAFGLGASIVGGSALASFKIKPAGAPAKKKGSLFAPVDMNNFYNKSGVFIEKNTFRINTPGELKEITFKGISSQKRKKIFGA